MSLKELCREPVSWLDGTGPRSDLVLSSRVRLARNLMGRPFPHQATEGQGTEVHDLVTGALPACPRLAEAAVWELESLTDWGRRVLVERHLASPRLGSGRGRRSAVAGPGGVGLLVNEEDHLRIQSVVSGFHLQSALDSATGMDRELEDALDYATSDRHGYLTACPTNTGTGMRASALVHLPGLVLTGEMKKVHQAVGEMGMVVRGWFGEGSRVVGDYYQISNQRTLGRSEDDLVAELDRVVERVLELELEARERVVDAKPQRRRIEDRIHRSRSILAVARMLTVEQAMACVSDVWLGKWMGRFEDVSGSALHRWTVFAQPAHLGFEAEALPESEEAQWLRAREARRWFGESSPAQ